MIWKTLPGNPSHLGALWDGQGVNFAIYSERAEHVELCLLDDDGREQCLPMQGPSAHVWHLYIQGARPGQRYGYRVHGPWQPERGLRFNPRVRLLDPYARAVDGPVRWDAGAFGYQLGADDLTPATEAQGAAPWGLVVDDRFDWEDDGPPRVPMHQTVIYEAHVRGLTMLHPEVPEELRGTYLGVAHPAIVRHLRELGVTAIELMPVHAFIDDKGLLDRGLRNYWGYNTLGFFAPETRYRAGDEAGAEVRQFKEMVKALHRAGIEVILDVVYNHTAEGSERGPTFNLRGIDNPTYYRLVEGNERYYFDVTGTGNTLNVRHPQALALVVDSLLYWVNEMHVDGFRFDLAAALARQLYDVDPLSSFFTLLHQAPALREVKLIAEPWDTGPGGYQVGNFPARWAEWNGRFRDDVRSFWCHRQGTLHDLIHRLTGSGDIYAGQGGRSPAASVNFVTAHDGFTLADLVSYDQKHNEANGEDNRDGDSHNRSWNCGAEGPTDDPEVRGRRRRLQRNLLATLLLAQGTPMLLAGDELGRTQRGNNNAYCQDSDLTWTHWELDDEQRQLLEFTRRLVQVRRAHPALQRARFLRGQELPGTALRDVMWFRPDGQPLDDGGWHDPNRRGLVMFLAGRGLRETDAQGRPLVSDDLLLLINGGDEEMEMRLPDLRPAVSGSWQQLVDTADDEVDTEGEIQSLEALEAPDVVHLVGRSLRLYRGTSRAVRAVPTEQSLLSTYRLQLRPEFDFDQARQIIDYLDALGITDVYTSPPMAASADSPHGYDLLDHGAFRREIGGQAGFEGFAAALRGRGLGLLLDWVPNHMGVGVHGNGWWDDVLEHGPASRHADHFDIDWDTARPDLRDRVMLPVLGDTYGEVLERGELRLDWHHDRFVIRYFERRLPVGPEAVSLLLERLERLLPAADADAHEELSSLRWGLSRLPARHERSEEAQRERARENERLRRRLCVLLSTDEGQAARQRLLDEVNGAPGFGTSFDALDEVLQAQSYRLSHWRLANEQINYRRFFDVNQLAAVRMEDPVVFEAAHRMLTGLVLAGQIKGLRIDHVDGLYDPAAYLYSLQGQLRGRLDGVSGLTADDLARPVPVLVEKILAPEEALPTDWPVDGTTGYEFLAAVGGLWVDGRSERAFTRLYQRFTGDRRSFADHVHESKHEVLANNFVSEVNLLVRTLERIAAADRRSRDFSTHALAIALRAVMAAFPVYRTYLVPEGARHEQDVASIRHAIGQARKHQPALGAILDFIERILLLQEDSRPSAEQVQFALRFQQMTGPVTAKAVEDTAFYRYPRLLCLNEVGGEPGHFGTTPEAFHSLVSDRARRWPLAMATTATHDTKRGEDASARIAVLTEMPTQWSQTVDRWSALTAALKPALPAGVAPSPIDEYTYYQALVGAWPFTEAFTPDDEFVGRMVDYMQKALREAKTRTSWLSPDEPYEAAVRAFVTGSLRDPAFVAAVRAFCDPLSSFGASNALAQATLRLCSPGVVDTYQGTELWHQPLVDPDNRRPVDYALRRRLLDDLHRRGQGDRRALARELLADHRSGAIKLHVVHTLLQARREHRALFLLGDYHPLPGSEHLVAFVRQHRQQRLVVCVARLPLRLTDGRGPWATGSIWGNRSLRLPAGTYRELLTGASVGARGNLPLAKLFADLPVAVLLQESDRPPPSTSAPSLRGGGFSG